MPLAPHVEAREIWKEFAQPGQSVVALRGVDLRIEAGEFVAVTGESGSGKSTLLSLLCALDRPTRGKILLFGEALDSAPQERLAEIRRESIGFVFQDFLLVRHLSVLDNVRLPFLFTGSKPRDDRISRLLEMVNLGPRMKHRPDALSRGEMQRVALVRALVNEPKLLFADEPTANLDRCNAGIIWDLMRDLNRKQGLTVIVATHSVELAQNAGRIVRLEDGRMVADETH